MVMVMSMTATTDSATDTVTCNHVRSGLSAVCVARSAEENPSPYSFTSSSRTIAAT